MIHDAQVEVTCDGKNCHESVYVDLEYVYGTYSGESGQYDSDEKAIEKTLTDEHDWTIQDNKHFCEDCSENIENENN